MFVCKLSQTKFRLKHLIFKHVKNILNTRQSSVKTKILPHTSLLTGLVSFNFFWFYKSYNNPLKIKQQYWNINSISELIEEADKLFSNEEYLEIYETLNRLKYQDNVEIQWRICRALFKMSCAKDVPSYISDNMIKEAYDLISRTLILDDKHPQVHKWMAIILDRKSSLDGIIPKLKASATVKSHMLKSIEYDNQDPSLLYMLGYWCYEISQMSWIQRKIAKTLFLCPPDTSYEEAYEYFSKAEQLRPRFFIGNIYMLGMCSYYMGHYYRARYYLKIAAEHPAYTDLERKHIEHAKKLSAKLQDYDVTIKTLGIICDSEEKVCYKIESIQEEQENNSKINTITKHNSTVKISNVENKKN